MTIRRRLILWYGTLFVLALALVTGLAYAVHARGHYDDRDNLLLASADRAGAEAAAMPNGPHLVEGADGLQVSLRYYDAAGVLQGSTPGAAGLPVADPPTVLRAPAGPAYDLLAGVLPPLLEPPPLSGAGRVWPV